MYSYRLPAYRLCLRVLTAYQLTVCVCVYLPLTNLPSVFACTYRLPTYRVCFRVLTAYQLTVCVFVYLPLTSLPSVFSCTYRLPTYRLCLRVLTAYQLTVCVFVYLPLTNLPSVFSCTGSLIMDAIPPLRGTSFPHRGAFLLPFTTALALNKRVDNFLQARNTCLARAALIIAPGFSAGQWVLSRACDFLHCKQVICYNRKPTRRRDELYSLASKIINTFLIFAGLELVPALLLGHDLIFSVLSQCYFVLANRSSSFSSFFKLTAAVTV